MSQYSSKFISVSEPVPKVLLIELNRKPVNAFSNEFWDAYGDLFDALTKDGYDVRAAVVSSALPKIFTAGLDLAGSLLSSADAGVDGSRSSMALRRTILAFQHSIRAPERAPFPVIAAVHGPVIGLGVDIISQCDIRYAASNASFAIKEVDVGLAADIGSLAFVPKVTGNESLVREYAYTGQSFSAVEAEKMGLLSKIVPGGRDEVVKEALALAALIASKSPIAVTGTKHLIGHSRDNSVDDNLAYTAAWNAFALMTKDVGENFRAMKAKDSPKFEPLKPKL